MCHLIEVGKLVVWDQLQNHCSKYGIIHPNHQGSVPLHDCTSAVGQLEDAASMTAEDKKLAALVMLDQTAAFDLVGHGLLPAKMKVLQFWEATINWFRSYMGGRWFSVRVESSTSELLPLGDKGVPQGSILGSLLFVISQIDLPFQTTHPLPPP